MRLFSRTCLVICLLGSLWAATALAATPDQAPGWRNGRWQGEVQLGLDFAYHTNLELNSREDQGRLVQIVSPLLQIQRDLGDQSFVRLGYQALVAVTDHSNVFRHDFSGENWWSNSIHTQARLVADHGLYLDLDHCFLRTTDRQGSDNHYRLGLKTTRRVNQLSINPGLQLGPDDRLEAHLGYGTREYDAQECDLQNQRQHQLGLTYWHTLTPGLAWFGQYLYIMRDYLDQNPGAQEDFFRHELYLGLRWAGQGGLQGEIKVGGAGQDYYEPYNKEDYPYDPVLTPVAAAHLDFKPLDGLRISLDFHRELLESPFSGEGYSNAQANTLKFDLVYQPDPGLEFFGGVGLESWDFHPLGDAPTLREEYWRAGGGLAFYFGRGFCLRWSWWLEQRFSDQAERNFQDHSYIVSLIWRL